MPTQQQCTYCDRKFTRTEHLARHIRSHTKQKPFSCSVCGKAYIREDTLLRHARSHSVDGQKNDHRQSQNASESQLSPEQRSPGSQGQSANFFSTAALDNAHRYLSDQHMNVRAAQDSTALNRPGVPQLQMTGVSASAGESVDPLEFQDVFGTPMGAWDFGNSSMIEAFPTWTVDDIFSLHAAHVAREATPAHDMRLLHLPRNVDASRSTEMDSGGPLIHEIGNAWFTKVPSSDKHSPSIAPLSPTESPEAFVSEAVDINDQYRLGLSKKFFTPLPPEDPLPSADFMNLCIRMYFDHFNPIFPALHRATFRPTAENGLLLLSMTSLGCLFIGAPAAVRQGKQIFSRLNKAILASWENIFACSKIETLAMLQAAMIGQTFALLSGEPNHIATFDTFHGSLVSLARRAGVFNAQPAAGQVSALDTFPLETRWMMWAKQEEINRLRASLLIHDAEMSALLHREPLLRQHALEPPRLSPDRMYSAATASEWESFVNSSATMNELANGNTFHDDADESFNGYTMIEGLGSSIAEDRRRVRLSDAASRDYHEALVKWYKLYGGSASEKRSGKLCTIVLWHWTYMSLLVDFDQLERALGRDGPEAAAVSMEYVSDWISSPNSTRCVLHALLLQRQIQSLRFDQVPAIHVPRIILAAAIAWYCYLQYGPGPTNDVTGIFDDLLVHFPEFEVLNSATYKQISDVTTLSWKRGDTSALKATTLCKLSALLQRTIPWGIAGRFADIVALLIYNGPQKA